VEEKYLCRDAQIWVHLPPSGSDLWEGKQIGGSEAVSIYK